MFPLLWSISSLGTPYSLETSFFFTHNLTPTTSRARREVGPIVETEDETFDLGGLLPVPVTPEWLRQFEKYILPHP